MTAISYIYSGDILTFISADGVPKTIIRSNIGDSNWDIAREAIKAGDLDVLEHLADTRKTFNRWSGGNIIVDGDSLYYKNKNITDNYAAKTAIRFMKEGLPFEPVMAFLDNLMENPSYRAVEDTYKFIEFNQMPLTYTGGFVAYKRVTGGYKDIYTESIDNSIGREVSMDRNMVDEDPQRTCSRGLHVCGYGYLSCFGSCSGNRAIAVVVNPKDVVAVPVDYNNAKMRVCKYIVAADVTEQADSSNFLSRESIFNESYYD